MEKNESGGLEGALKPAIRVVLIMLAVTGVAYPLSLVIVGELVFPFQSTGSIVHLDGKAAGSVLIAQEFASPKFFHPRVGTESASGVDPHITPESAYSQIPRVSEATGIPSNHLNTLVRLNIEINKTENLGVLAPDYVNVLTLNLDLIDQYPEVYSEFMELRANDSGG